MNISTIGENKETLQAKIIVIGDSGVGKSTLISNFTKRNSAGNIQNNKVPFPDISERIWELADGRKVKMTILDTGGLERYRSLTSSYYRGVHGCLTVFNNSELSSFDSVPTWIRDLRQYTADQDRISTVLVGTTMRSSKRVISKEKAENLAQYLCIPYIEVQLDGNNSSDAFEKLASLIFERYQRRCSIVSSPTTKITLSQYKHSCCNC